MGFQPRNFKRADLYARTIVVHLTCSIFAMLPFFTGATQIRFQETVVSKSLPFSVETQGLKFFGKPAPCTVNAYQKVVDAMLGSTFVHLLQAIASQGFQNQDNTTCLCSFLLIQVTSAATINLIRACRQF